MHRGAHNAACILAFALEWGGSSASHSGIFIDTLESSFDGPANSLGVQLQWLWWQFRIIYLTYFIQILYTWVRASWIEFNNCPTRCDLFSLLHFCRQLYMFRVLTPIIRSSYNCNYGFWYWLPGSTIIRCNYSCTSSWWWLSTPETCRAAYRNVISWILSHLVGQLLNYILDIFCHSHNVSETGSYSVSNWT